MANYNGVSESLVTNPRAFASTGVPARVISVTTDPSSSDTLHYFGAVTRGSRILMVGITGSVDTDAAVSINFRSASGTTTLLEVAEASGYNASRFPGHEVTEDGILFASFVSDHDTSAGVHLMALISKDFNPRRTD